ncbi:hypothetical protein Neosp_015087 [[Neocosmospora] mangrovei]
MPTTRSSKPGNPEASGASSKAPALKSTDFSPFDVVPAGETRPLKSAAPSTSLHPRGSHTDRSLRARQVLRFLDSEHRKNADASYQVIQSVDQGFYRLKALAECSAEQGNEEDWPASWANSKGTFKSWVNGNLIKWLTTELTTELKGKANALKIAATTNQESRSNKHGDGVSRVQAATSSSKTLTGDLAQANEAQAVAPKGPSQPPVATNKPDKTSVEDTGKTTAVSAPVSNTDTSVAVPPSKKATASSLADEPRDSPVPVHTGCSIQSSVAAEPSIVPNVSSVDQPVRPLSTPLISTPNDLIIQPKTSKNSASVGVYDKDAPVLFASESTATPPSNIGRHAAGVTQHASTINVTDTAASVGPGLKVPPVPMQYGSLATQLATPTPLPAQAVLSEGITPADTQKTPPAVGPDSGLAPSTFPTHTAAPTASGSTTAAVALPSTTPSHHCADIGHRTTKETGMPNSSAQTLTILPGNSMDMSSASNLGIFSRKNSAVHLGTDGDLQAGGIKSSRAWGMASIRDSMPAVGELFGGKTFSVFRSDNAEQAKTETPRQMPTSPSAQDSQPPTGSGGMGLTEANLHVHDVSSAQSSSYGSNLALPPVEWYEWYKEYHAGQRQSHQRMLHDE